MVVFRDGKIEEQGSYLDLMNKPASALRRIIEESAGPNFNLEDSVMEDSLIDFNSSSRREANVFVKGKKRKSKKASKGALKKSKGKFSKNKRSKTKVSQQKRNKNKIGSKASQNQDEENNEEDDYVIDLDNSGIRAEREADEIEMENELNEGADRAVTPTTPENPSLSKNKAAIMRNMSYSSIMKTAGNVIDDESLNFKEAMSNLKMFLFLRGKFPLLMIILLFIISSFFAVSYDLWIGFWTNKTFGDLGDANYFYAYIALGIIGTIYLTVRDIVYDCIISGSANLINDLVIEKIFRLSMKWFDRQPLKRVMYRLTKDQSQLYVLIPKIVLGLIESSLMLLAGALVVGWLFIAMVPIVTIILVFVVKGMLKRYLRVTLKVSHYISISKFEVVSSCAQILNLATSLRSSKSLDGLIDEFWEVNDKFQANLTNVGNFSQRWIGIRLAYISSILAFVSFCYPILPLSFIGFLAVDAYEIGLGITWSLKTIKYLKKFIRTNSLVFINMISISRLYEYSNTEDMVESSPSDEKPRFKSKKKILKLAEENEISEAKQPLSRRGNPQKALSRQRSKVKQTPTGLVFNSSRGVISQSNVLKKSSKSLFGMDSNNKTLCLRNVSMSTEGSRQILFNISMKIRDEKMVGLYGRSMSGIRNLLEVICGLYERLRDGKHLDSAIEMYGASIDLQSNEDWRSCFMFLEEEPMIVSGTVRDNIDPYNKFDDDLIIKTLDFLKFNELINAKDNLAEEQKRLSSLGISNQLLGDLNGGVGLFNDSPSGLFPFGQNRISGDQLGVKDSVSS